MGTMTMPPPSLAKDPAAITQPRILIIDDDRDFCALVADYLAAFGYVVSAAHTGPAGVDKAASEPWQAIILDVMLPGFDGFEVLRRIRRAGDTPVLMLTARGDEADQIVGLEIGAGRLPAQGIVHAAASGAAARHHPPRDGGRRATGVRAHGRDRRGGTAD